MCQRPKAFSVDLRAIGPPTPDSNTRRAVSTPHTHTAWWAASRARPCSTSRPFRPTITYVATGQWTVLAPRRAPTRSPRAQEVRQRLRRRFSRRQCGKMVQARNADRTCRAASETEIIRESGATRRCITVCHQLVAWRTSSHCCHTQPRGSVMDCERHKQQPKRLLAFRARSRWPGVIPPAFGRKGRWCQSRAGAGACRPCVDPGSAK